MAWIHSLTGAAGAVSVSRIAFKERVKEWTDQEDLIGSRKSREGKRAIGLDASAVTLSLSLPLLLCVRLTRDEGSSSSRERRLSLTRSVASCRLKQQSEA